jgi:c-di-GMP-binding flagellar brake protein YcgR
MMELHSERRVFKRVLFTIEDQVSGLISSCTIKGLTIKANVLNLSQGGICLTIPRTKDFSLQKGDQIVLLQVKIPDSSQFLTNIDARIKWIMDQPDFEYLGIGCEFINLPNSSEEQLKSFVQSWQQIN